MKSMPDAGLRGCADQNSDFGRCETCIPLLWATRLAIAPESFDLVGNAAIWVARSKSDLEFGRSTTADSDLSPRRLGADLCAAPPAELEPEHLRQLLH